MLNNPRETQNKQANHLEGQTSPYLLQHLYNPVDWHPWSKEALEKARAEDKPILVSIGYSACHWCHVMEKESFEDAEVAEMMNRDFVCIKVDREERPDIDHIYMTAIQLLTRQGGWPLNCFALPDTRPFWGGTYFPKHQWKSILMQVAELYKARKQDIIEQAEQLVAGISASGFVELSDTKSTLNPDIAHQVYRNIMTYMDTNAGGTKNAPKFPLPVNHEFLLHYHYLTSDTPALDQVNLSLEKMSMGGIYDQIGGGFARYSTDIEWKVPHFEKMLYDNAQLVSLYSKAWKLTKRYEYKKVVYQTIEFIKRELTSPEGVFYSALDADSEGEEGRFYVWKESEIESLAGIDPELVKEYYSFGGKGYWENGNNILLREFDDEGFARSRNITTDELRQIIVHANNILLQTRKERIRPGLDNKILTSWNALMITGLVEAYTAFGDEEFLKVAENAMEFILIKAVMEEGKVYRNLTAPGAETDGFLDDYAHLLQCLIRLFEVTMKTEYLHEADKITSYVIRNFSSEGTCLFSYSSNNGEKLPASFYELPDNVIPSSNSIMALNLFSLSHALENSEWRELSLQMLMDMIPKVQEHSISFANWSRLLLNHIFPYYTVLVCGPRASEMLKELHSLYLPHAFIAGTAIENEEMILFKSRFNKAETRYYICQHGSCRQPVIKLEDALAQLIPQ